MKKLVSIMAVAAFMLSMNVNAQQEPKQKKKEKSKEKLTDRYINILIFPLIAYQNI